MRPVNLTVRDLTAAMPKGEITKESATKMRKTAEDFESLFLDILMKSMRSTVPDSGLTSGGHGEDVYKSMLDAEYSKSMAHNHNSGIADMIEKQMIQMGGGRDMRPK